MQTGNETLGGKLQNSKTISGRSPGDLRDGEDWLRSRSSWQVGQDTHHKQSRVRSTSTELGQERAGTSVPGHAGAQGTRAAPHGAGWSPGVGRRLSKSRRVARHQTGCCLLLLFACKQHRTLLPTRTTQRGPSGTKGQRPTWLPCPASLSGCGVDGAEENPSQDIDFNFLRIKKKKTKPNRQKTS